MSNTTGDNAMSNFVTIRLAQDERVTDCGGLVFVEMENSAGESINLYPQHVSEDGAICIDIPQDASVSEIQRLQAQIAELQSAKASAVSVPEWISINDKQPDDEGRYLIHHSITPAISKTFIADYCMRDDGTFFWSCNPDVTHWMPLPEPPINKPESSV